HGGPVVAPPTLAGVHGDRWTVRLVSRLPQRRCRPSATTKLMRCNNGAATSLHFPVAVMPASASVVWIRPRLLGRSRCGFARWHNPEHEGRYLFPGFERTGNLVADRVQTLEKSRDRHGVIRCECRKTVTRHDRRQHAVVRPSTDLSRLHDLLWGPTTDAGLFVGCDV